MRDAFIQELTELARSDESVFLIVGDLGFSVIESFAEEFPDRFLNPGVAEQAMIGIAAGLAATGYKVFVYSIGNFPTMRCIEQIRNDVSYHKRNVTVVSVGGGYSYGYLGYTHHAIEDIAVMRALPNMTVLSPADPVEARALTRLASQVDGPTYLRLGKNKERVLPCVEDALPHARVLRAGDDISVFVTGAIAEEALAASEALSGRGVSVGVISVPMVKPIGTEVLRRLAPSGLALSVEEHTTYGGLGSALLEAGSRLGVPMRLRMLGSREETLGGRTGSTGFHRTLNGLDRQAIENEVLAALGIGTVD